MAQHWRRVLDPLSPFGLVARVQQYTRGTKPLPVRWYSGRAGIIPFRSLERKGPRTSGETRVTCHPGNKNTEIELHHVQGCGIVAPPMHAPPPGEFEENCGGAARCVCAFSQRFQRNPLEPSPPPSFAFWHQARAAGEKQAASSATLASTTRTHSHCCQNCHSGEARWTRDHTRQRSPTCEQGVLVHVSWVQIPLTARFSK